MSILPDHLIVSARERGFLSIEPWEESNLQPASVDLTLANEFLRFSEEIDVTRPWEPQHLWDAPEIVDEFILQPGEFALGSTIEYISLAGHIAGEVWGKSSLGRVGLSVHVTAGFVDPGFRGQITLEFFNVSPVPITLKAGMPICQMVFTSMPSPSETTYLGRYQGQRGVSPSLYYLNLKEDKE
jgi:dCTP deaminase